MVSINLDITLFIQIVNFIIALLVLNFVLISPIRGILKQRRDLVEGMAADANKFNEESSLRIKNYESELDAVRLSAAELKEAAKQQGVAAEQSIIADAQAEAMSFLQKTRKEVEQEAEEAIKALRAQVDAMAGKVVAKVLD